MMKAMQLQATVIVPTYNAAHTLKACLNALLAQRTTHGYEILVVDDGSTDDTDKILSSFPKVRVLKRKNKGPASARNEGATAAKNPLIIFTDSDCEPASNWLEESLKPFKDPDVAGVQGAYKTRQRGLLARFVQIEIEHRYEKMKHAKNLDWIGSYSAAYRRDIFLEVQGFDTDFRKASGEDPALSYQLSKQGHKLVFNPAAIVYHRHPTDLLDYLHRKFQHAYWRVLLYKKNPDKAVADSYTPQALKLQLAALLALPAALVLGLLFPPLLLLIPLGIGAFFLFMLPFIFFALFRDVLAGLAAPFILALRNGAFLAGIGAGVFNGLWKKP